MRTSLVLASLCLSSVAMAQEPAPPAPGAPAAPITQPGAPVAPVTAPPPVTQPIVGPVAPHATPTTPMPPEKPVETEHAHAKPKPKWYEKLSMRGYAQVRYNRLGSDLGLFGEKNDRYTSPLGDKSIGKTNSFAIRRARLIVQGDVTDHVFAYVQADFANAIGDSANFVQTRDFYADVAIDDKKEFRIRFGQSKVPYGWENMQSSQNRLTLDRSEPINTAVPGERDLGVFFYWAPAAKRALFKRLVDDGLKGSGDYGIVAFGVYNGQSANQVEKNNSRHVVARVTFPVEIGSQIIEAGVAGYMGKFVVPLGAGANVPKIEDGEGRDVDNIKDMRAEAAFVLYPKPIGFQAEYNVGKGPETRDGVLKARSLYGGYAMTMVKLGHFMPFVRYQQYHGGRKHETNAPTSHVSEIEPGIEWQADRGFELTASYAYGRRTCPAENKDHTSCGYNNIKAGSTGVTGQMFRLQAQMNF